MAKICLLKPEITKLREALENGTIDMNELHDMPSEQRGKLLRELLGEDGGAFANGVFEKKLLLKNQQRAMESWINKMVDTTPTLKRDMLSKVSRMDKILSETDQDKFLSELAETKLGAKVTADEANTLLKLSQDAKAKESFIGTDNRMEYGAARRKFDNYLDDLKNPANKMSFADTTKEFAKSVRQNPLNLLRGVGGLAKSLKSAYDNSVLLRQGFKVLLSSPKTWGRNAKNSFSDFWKTATKQGENPMDIVMADIYSRANVGRYEKMKLALGVDEFIPTTVQEKIPVIGRGFKASDNAFKGFQFRSRADLADIYLEQAKKLDIDIDDPEFLKGIGNYINQQTGRGNLGKLDKIGNELNNVFFSPRFLASHIETITQAITGGQGFKNINFKDAGQNFIRRKAAIQLGKIATIIATFSALNEAMGEEGKSYDPRSTKFGKVKVGSGYNDVTGGFAPLVTFLTRIATSKSVSASGKETSLSSDKFGAENKEKIVGRYIRGKLAPIPATLYSLLLADGKDPVGKEMNVGRTTASLVAPIPVANAIETAQEDNAEEYIGSQLLDILGAASSKYNR
jgi:hypothetical protein